MKRRLLAPTVSALVLLAHPVLAQQAVLTEQISGVQATLQAVSPANDSVVWVGGHAGAILRTLDGGRTWVRLSAPGGDSLQFRDVHAVNGDTAYVLSAGPGERSRIYRTNDGGASWRLQFLNRDSSAFYDCFDFWDPRHGIVVSDAVDGRLVVMATQDGETWRRVSRDVLPAALSGEGGFAASGTCLVVRRPGYVWIGSGGEGQARVYRSPDGGRSWTVTSPPFGPGSPASGVTTVALRDSLDGVALGGDIGAPDASGTNAAITADGGRTWMPAARPPFPGAVYGSAYAAGSPAVLVAVGPRGAAFSQDDGRTWTALSWQSYWAVAFSGSGRGWMVGPGGRITRVEF